MNDEGFEMLADQQFRSLLSEAYQALMIPGDIVDTGSDEDEWRDAFFAPGSDVLAEVPLIPALGNHDLIGHEDNYFEYMHLPEHANESDYPYPEQYFRMEYPGAMILSLNTNRNNSAQQTWLQQQLDSVCNDDSVSFVVAQMHHPHESELWLPGESNFARTLSDTLSEFSTQCNKPTIHLFGHTHAYSKGVSTEHQHAFVNVASGAGTLDYVGEFPQRDYAEFDQSIPVYGFTTLDVKPGDKGSISVRAYSMGNREIDETSQIHQQFSLVKNNGKPATPSLTSTPLKTCPVVKTSQFSDNDSDTQYATQFQVVPGDCASADFSADGISVYQTHRNRFGNKHLRFSDVANALVLQSHHLSAGKSCVRARHRDEHFAWSDWSAKQSIELTGSESSTANLLTNPGAESGSTGWDSDALNVLPIGGCDDVPDVVYGSGYFAPGKVCNNGVESGKAWQDISLTNNLSNIDSGKGWAEFGGKIRSWRKGNDVGTLRLVYLDQSDKIIGESSVSNDTEDWTNISERAWIEPGTRKIRFVMESSHSSSDSDSYFDDLFLKVRTDELGCEPPVVAPVFIQQGNLIQNASAEHGLVGWQSAGLESLSELSDCSVPSDNDTPHFFAVGGVCQSGLAKATVTQRLDLSDYHYWIEKGELNLTLSAAMRNYSGSDKPSVIVEFYGNNYQDIGASPVSISTNTSQWTDLSQQASVPKGTVYVNVSLQGERFSGTDNDSYIDDIGLVVYTDTAPQITHGNLVKNGDASNGTTDWVADNSTAMDSGNSSCTIPSNNDGPYFNIGGVCGNGVHGASLRQTLDISGYEYLVKQGKASISFGATMRNWSGSDRANVHVEFFSNGSLLSKTQVLEGSSITWKQFLKGDYIPADTDRIDVVVTNTWKSGSDSDAYADDIWVTISR